MPLRIIYLLICILIFSTCRAPWRIYKGLPKPDYSFSTGSTHGYDGYVWNCYEGHAVIVYRAASEYDVGRWQKKELPCGDSSKIKTQYKGAREFHKLWKSKKH